MGCTYTLACMEQYIPYGACTHGHMDTWMDEWMDGWTVGWVDG